jgi:hypothetical protein
MSTSPIFPSCTFLSSSRTEHHTASHSIDERPSVRYDAQDHLQRICLHATIETDPDEGGGLGTVDFFVAHIAFVPKPQMAQVSIYNPENFILRTLKTLFFVVDTILN